MGHPLGSPRHLPSSSPHLPQASPPQLCCPCHRPGLSVRPLCHVGAWGKEQSPVLLLKPQVHVLQVPPPQTHALLLPHLECVVFLLLASNPIAHVVNSLTPSVLMTPTQGSLRRWAPSPSLPLQSTVKENHKPIVCIRSPGTC